MNNFGHEYNNSSELLRAQAHVWNHIFNYINSMSLKCVVELDIPDIIHSHGKPITISELNNAISVHPNKAQCTRRLMRILVHSGFFALAKTNHAEEEAYILTNASQLLLKGNPFSLRQLVLAQLGPTLTKPWPFLSRWFINNDSTAFATTHGMPVWDYTRHDPDFNSVFSGCLESDCQIVMSVILDQGKEVLNGLNSVVDVGGGTGTLAKAIAKEFPHIECIVLDLPHVVAGLNNTPNVKYVAGDMFESIPPADALLFKWIFHDWGDEESLKILKQCKKAIEERKGGKVIIIDMVIMEEAHNKEAIETQLFFDLLMMVAVTGKERNEKEWTKLFFDAGFKSYKIIPILGLRSIIEVYP